MQAVAVKKSSREKTTGFQEMGTLRCDGCGEEFVIGHKPQSTDQRVAEKQARWLEKATSQPIYPRKKWPSPNPVTICPPGPLPGFCNHEDAIINPNCDLSPAAESRFHFRTGN
jgi:hypothetical protein